jgi:hypothetical protein
MKKMTILKTAAAASAVAVLVSVAARPSPALAEEPYRWCAEYGGRDAAGTNCGFETFAQCQATVHGIGGYCYENPDYGLPPPRKKRAPAR